MFAFECQYQTSRLAWVFSALALIALSFALAWLSLHQYFLLVGIVSTLLLCASLSRYARKNFVGNRLRLTTSGEFWYCEEQLTKDWQPLQIAQIWLVLPCLLIFDGRGMQRRLWLWRDSIPPDCWQKTLIWQQWLRHKK